MGTQGNEGLSLEAIAKRLEALERENERISSENAELRHKVATMESSSTERAELPALRDSDTGRDGESMLEFDGKVSRRAMLSKAGAAAIAAVAAGTLAYPREARADTTFFDTVQAAEVQVHTRGVTSYGTVGVWGKTDSAGQAGVYGEQQNLGSGGPGVVGDAKGSSHAGVLGRNPNGAGVWGKSPANGYEGVYGQHTGTSGYGVVGDGKGEAGAGVLGRNSEGTGVHGQSSKSGYGGVTAEHTGTAGFGVIGLGTGATGAGVLGRNSSGIGVKGEGNNGVHGKATGGYGGLFEGGKAQLRLVPKSTAGKPTTGAHTKGEIYMDSTGTLFVCTLSGTPGTWRKVTTTTA